MRIELRPNLDELVGAKVLRTCFIAGKDRRPGDTLTAEEVRTIPVANYRAIVDNHYILPLLTDPAFLKELFGSQPTQQKTEIFVVRRTDLRYDVVRGVKLNDGPMSKADADALANSHTQ